MKNAKTKISSSNVSSEIEKESLEKKVSDQTQPKPTNPTQNTDPTPPSEQPTTDQTKPADNADEDDSDEEKGLQIDES